MVFNMDIGKFRFAFIGFGHFAEILYSSFIKAKLLTPSQVVFIRRDKDKQKETSIKFGISSTSLSNLMEKSDIIFFCVRPQNIMEVLEALPKDIDIGSKLFISILAGTKLSFFYKNMGANIQLLRVMPNLPSRIGEGMNVLCFGKHVEEEYIFLSKRLFRALGEIEEVSEEMLDVVTAMSGSGPAFAASLMDTIAKFGYERGLSYEKSLRIACQTFIGTAKLIGSGKTIEQLLNEIALPGGTTEAGLEMMIKSNVLSGFKKVLKAAYERALQLGKPNF